VTFRRLAQIIGIRPVMNDPIMLIVAARIGGGPPHNGHVADGLLELWSVGDLNVLGSLLRREDLSDRHIEQDQAAGRRGDGHYRDPSIH